MAPKNPLEKLSLLGDNNGKEAGIRRIQNFVRSNGKVPFEEWILSLKDKSAKARIFARIDRVRFGNFGDSKSVGKGVFELRFSFGPGYRVYFGVVDNEIVLLLGGGDKTSQRRDIEACQRYWKEFNNDTSKKKKEN